MKNQIFISLFCLPIFLQSQVIVSYDFDSCDVDPSYVVSGFSATNFTNTLNVNFVGSGCPAPFSCNVGCTPFGQTETCSSSGRSYITRNWTGSSINLSKYIQFTISTNPLVSFNISTMEFHYRSSSTGPNNMYVYIDGSPMFGYSLFTTESCYYVIHPINLTRTGSAQFRIYAWGGSSTGTFRLDNIRVSYSFTTLPIELSFFEGYSRDGYVELLWTTETEISNSHFEIEKSIDSKNFTRIGIVSGAGDSQSQLSYSYFDYEFVPGVCYYRLKQVDLDGGFEYSNTVSVSNESDFTISNGIVSYNGKNVSNIYDLSGRFVHNLNSSPYDFKGKGILIVQDGNNFKRMSIQ